MFLDRFFRNNNLSNIAFIGFSILAIFPFLALCFYNHPLGVHEFEWISNINGQFDHRFWDYQVDSYLVNGGRYSSSFVLSLTPFWYSISSFQYFFFGSIILFGFSFFYFIKKLFDYDGRKITPYLFALGFSAFFLFNVAGVFDSIYRYTSVLTYLIGMISLLFYLGLFIDTLKSDKVKIWKITLLSFLAFFSVGTNEISMFFIFSITYLVLYFHFVKKITIPKWLFLIGLILLISVLFAILAPGNFHRMSNYGDQPFSLFKGILVTIGCSVFTMASWIANPIFVLFGILVFPILIKNTKSERLQKIFDIPIWYVILLLVISIPISYFPMIMGTKGTSFAERVIDITFFHTTLILLYLLQFLAFRLSGKFPNLSELLEGKIFRYSFFILGIFTFCYLLFGKIELNRGENISKTSDRIQFTSNIGNAYKTLLDGSAKSYANTMSSHYNIVKNCKSDTCIVPMPTIFPVQLYEKISDRRNRKNGEQFLGHSLGVKEVRTVRYPAANSE